MPQYSHQVGTHSFGGISPLWPALPGKARKPFIYFYLTQNTCLQDLIRCQGTEAGFGIKWHPTPVLLPGKSHGWRSLVGCRPWGHYESNTTIDFTFTFHFHALEKEMATHSSVLAWRIPGTGEPYGLLSMGLHRVRHD